jgi:hypothetical protein
MTPIIDSVVIKPADPFCRPANLMRVPNADFPERTNAAPPELSHFMISAGVFTVLLGLDQRAFCARAAFVDSAGDKVLARVNTFDKRPHRLVDLWKDGLARRSPSNEPQRT